MSCKIIKDNLWENVDKKIKEKFWNYVDKKGEDECWIWKGYKKGGYGIFNCIGVTLRVHRETYKMKYGNIPKGMILHHRCDNLLCCNPKHLYTGIYTHPDFWENVDKKSEDECWEWRGSKNQEYGIYSCKGVPLRVHIETYKMEYGNIPKGMIVRHKCDNRSCCNPKHLELGTHKDNMNDIAMRNKRYKGFGYSKN